MQTQAEFETEIDGDFDEERGEYRIFQVVPQCLSYQTKMAIVGDVEDAYDVWESLSDWVKRIIQIYESKAEIQIYQDSDRCHAGYGNIYRGIKQLAPFVGDCRFFIAESYDDWVDDYSVRDGVLSFRRFRAPVDELAEYHPEGREWMMAHLVQQAEADDDELRVAMARHFGQVAQGSLDKVFGRDQQNHQRQAQAAIDRSTALQPPTAFVQLQAGRLHLVREENAKAEECFEHAQNASDPDARADAVMHLAALAVKDNNTKHAADLTAQLEQIDDYEALLLLVAIHRASDRKRATRYVDTLVDKLVNNPSQQPKPRSTILSPMVVEGLADLITDASHADEQKAAFLNKVVHGLEEHVSSVPKVYFEGANALLGKALTIMPSAATWFQRGRLHERHNPNKAKGKQQAIDCFKEATVHGEHREALLKLAEHHRESKQHSDAQGFYHRYFSASQQAESKGYGFNIYLWHGLFSYADCMLAQLEQRDGPEFIESLGYTRFALDTFVPWFEPADPIVIIGDLLSFQQRYDEAAVLYDLAVAGEPSCVQALSHKASGYCNLKKFDEANRVLDEAVAIDPTYWHIHYMRACITSLQDNIDDALEHLKKALVTMPENCKPIITQDSDLAALRSDDRYDALMEE